LHDASEAYLSDVTRPVKQELPQYLEIEKPLQEAIWRKYLEEEKVSMLVEALLVEGLFVINILGILAHVIS